MISTSSFSRIALPVVLTGLLAACAGTPAPDWQMNAKTAMERATAAYLEGNARVETQEFNLARSEISRTGRADLMARVELTRCAARVASLVIEECEDFEKLRTDAAAPERAYADYLTGKIKSNDIALLPAQHRTVAGTSSDVAAASALQGIEDPLARLVAAGVLFRSNRATPAILTVAADTASAQGWRRPLLAWLGVQLLRAENAGDAVEAERLRRRIALVENAATPRQP
ncbi:hypothetical protein [Herminiimonas fonticola]|uniref:Lipoprotein n=1 Tax=Herminiimonas fonticola TaxID=303380 RepID=A0A4V3BUR3_9BURK|nr:hypothetical protein [Herminiimonas fonticola]RBA23507.1 hypothetical protein Hfont_2318 [Herminiimonas fonticola]TDN88238.1 hypothetical protein EV677_2725 [Herminiimonas fonticola]